MKKVKLIISLFLLVLIVIISTACSKDGESAPSINVYNWGDYIDKSVIREFEDEFGIKVIYEDFETNEDLYVKLKQATSNYDVIIPSDYMIERMISENMLVKLNKSNIPNLTNVDEKFFNKDFDPNNDYSVPYMWGTVGIIYNKTMVDDVVDSWDILWNDKYENEIMMLNSMRDTIAVALKKLGYSMNTRDEKELEEAKLELIKQKSLVRAYLGDEIKDAIVGEEAAMAVVWSGDAVAMMSDNEDLEYIIPKEGTNLWFDSMVIPKSSKNKEGAEKFINFMSRPDISARNADYIGYSTPIPDAAELLPEEIKNSEVAYPREEKIKNTEVFKDPKDIIKTYEKIWMELISAN